MARKKKKKPTPKPAPAPAERPAVTPERFGRLHRLVRFLSEGPRSRDQLTSHLGLDVRGFYRDLEVLRAFGVEIVLEHGQYALSAAGEEALEQLPYPDPHLTLGEMQRLAKGRTAVHRKLSEQIEQLLS
jgi:predicted DNA-binding transcriptional regulator YafY